MIELSQADQCALRHLAAELHRVRGLHEPYVSAHHGLGVLWEELEELKREIFKREYARNAKALFTEAIQVAQVALRIAVDCSGYDPTTEPSEAGPSVTAIYHQRLERVS